MNRILKRIATFVSDKEVFIIEDINTPVFSDYNSLKNRYKQDLENWDYEIDSIDEFLNHGAKIFDMIYTRLSKNFVLYYQDRDEYKQACAEFLKEAREKLVAFSDEDKTKLQALQDYLGFADDANEDMLYGLAMVDRVNFAKLKQKWNASPRTTVIKLWKEYENRANTSQGLNAFIEKELL